MPQRIRKLRFPDGDSEYRTTEVHLKVGSVIRSRGKAWVIASVTEGLAILDWDTAGGDGHHANGDGHRADGDGTTPHSLAAVHMVTPGPTDEEPMVPEAVKVM